MNVTGVLDESLECFVGKGPEFEGGLSNHGPMAVEALVRMGRPEAALPWAVKYRDHLEDAPALRWAIEVGGWQDALGDERRAGDWTCFFDHELSAAPFREVANRWVPRLLPGLMAAATHGAIRSFHALRALDEEVTELRIHELAQALGYWAAKYQPLPGDPRPVGGRSPDEAAALLAQLAPKVRQRGLISDDMRELEGGSEFPTLVAAVEPASDILAAFSALTEIGARAYVANAAHAPIALVHAVTAPAAVRGLLGLLSPQQQKEALAYTWQTVAGLIATNAPAGLAPRLNAPQVLTREEIIQQAVASGDEHAIKLTEAALRENALSRDPMYLVAAADAVIRLAPDH